MSIFLDTETCGLHGMPVLLQYAVDDGPIQLYNLWKEPISETMALIEWIAEQPVIGFNLAFDWFQLSKLYTTFSLYPDPSAIPEDHIDELAILEEKARFIDLCIKPVSACDLMLHARKGKYQALMARDDIRIKRVPTVLADSLAKELEERIQIDGIYFAKRKDKYAPKWQIHDVHDVDGDLDPEFKDIVLKFSASGQLKALAEHALGYKEDNILKFVDVEVDRVYRPEEYGYAPFALAVGQPGNWHGAWPEMIERHISHWAHNRLARKYATNDITYTRDLYNHFDRPEPGDNDSELAIAVACARWHGFPINKLKLLKQRSEAYSRVGKVPTAPHVARRYIEEFMDADERKTLQGSTKKVLLEEIEKWLVDCPHCGGAGCSQCVDGAIPHPAAKRASEVLAARQALKEIEIYDKLLLAGRFHASFVVIGTLSSRMAGSDGLNPQGIKKTFEVRDCFPLADNGFILCGGDFDAFEVVLADADYNDPKLRADLLSGKKIHALFAEELFPDKTYEEILESKGTSNDLYGKGKQGVFSQVYGGDENTLMKKLGIGHDQAKKASDGFAKRYEGVGRARKLIFDMFCSMRQPGGIGTAVVWHEPADYIESIFGFRRYFTLENAICKALFQMAQTPPKWWKDVQITVRRRDRDQKAVGAVQSALYGAAFAIQAANMRAAANHRIQSSGATVTKHVQRRVWDHQPVGVHRWQVQCMNIHDEVLVATRPGLEHKVKASVDETVESYREKIPLIKMEFKIGMKSWAEK